MSTDWRVDTALEARLAGIRLAVFDVDGVLTDGRLYYGADGELMKAFHVHDGLGLKRLQANGISVAIITARSSDIVTRRAEELGIRHLFQGQQDKGACLAKLLESLSIDAESCAFMGDDQPDLAAMAVAGLTVAPANAVAEVRSMVDMVTTQCGGDGAVREFCDRVINARQQLQPHHPEQRDA